MRGRGLTRCPCHPHPTTASRHSPQAQAYHYLQPLDIGNSRSADGESIDDLDFFQGPCPGSNWISVETHDEVVLACLQRRLLDMGQDVRVVVA